MHQRPTTLCALVSTLLVSTNGLAEDVPDIPTPAAAPSSSASAAPAEAPPDADARPAPDPPRPAPAEPAARPPNSWADEVPYRASMWGPGVKPLTTQRSRWYGWQTLTVFLVGDVLSTAAIVIRPEAGYGIVLLGTLPIHILTGPVVHMAHGRIKAAFLSLGVNTALPVVSYWAGIPWGGALILGPLGLIGAHVIDIGVLSRETADAPASPPRGAQVLLPSSVTVVPKLDAQFRGFAIVGQF